MSLTPAAFCGMLVTSPTDILAVIPNKIVKHKRFEQRPKKCNLFVFPKFYLMRAFRNVRGLNKEERNTNSHGRKALRGSVNAKPTDESCNLKMV